jgi:uncharacterized SAM-binding protein YcdF (DUF218 family)
MALTSVTPIAYWWATALAGPWHDPKGDILIVLGGGVLANGQIGENSYWRAIYGAMAYREGGFREVIVSGGDAAGAGTGAPIRDYLRCQGIAEDRIVLEDRSSNTRENAVFTSQMLRGKQGRFVLLTSDYHMYRAWRAFRKAGVDVHPRPIPDIRRRALSIAGRWPACLELAEETAKIVYYWWQGWI